MMRRPIYDEIMATAKAYREEHGTLPAWRIARKIVLASRVKEAQRTKDFSEALNILECLVEELL
jgi:hypothetical protein